MNAIVITKRAMDKKRLGDPSFDALKWVLKAVCKDQLRKDICCLNSDGNGRFAGTDGHRLHVADLPEMASFLPSGNWKHIPTASPNALVFMENGGALYPVYDKVFPKEYDEKETVIHAGTEFKDWWWKFFQAVNVPVNMDYLSAALSGGGEWTIKRAKGDASTKAPVVLTCENPDVRMTALIMPLKA